MHRRKKKRPRIEPQSSPRTPAENAEKSKESGFSVRVAREILFDEAHGLTLIVQATVELRIFDSGKNFLEQRSRLVPGCDQIVAANERVRPHFLRRKIGNLLAREVVHPQAAMAGLAIESVQFKMLVKVRQPHKFL